MNAHNINALLNQANEILAANGSRCRVEVIYIGRKASIQRITPSDRGREYVDKVYLVHPATLNRVFRYMQGFLDAVSFSPSLQEFTTYVHDNYSPMGNGTWLSNHSADEFFAPEQIISNFNKI